MGSVATDVRAGESRKATDEVDQQQSRLDLGLALATVHFDLNQLLLHHVRILCGLRISIYRYAHTPEPARAGSIPSLSHVCIPRAHADPRRVALRRPPDLRPG